MESFEEAMYNYDSQTSLTADKKRKMWSDVKTKLFAMAPEHAQRARFILHLFSPKGMTFALTLVVATVIYLNQSLVIIDVSKNTEVPSSRNWAPASSTSSGGIIQKVADALTEKRPAGSPNYGYPVDIQPVDSDNQTPEEQRAKNLQSALRYYVSDVAAAVKDLHALVVEMKGYITYSSVDLKKASFHVKVPIEKFQEFKNRLSVFTVKLVMESTSITDRQSELTSMNEAIAKLKADLKKAEQNLSKATTDAAKQMYIAQIKSLKSQISYAEKSRDDLKESTNMALVSVEFAIDDVSFGAKLQNTLTKTITFLGEAAIVFVNWLIIAVAVSIPIVLVSKAVQFLTKRKQ